MGSQSKMCRHRWGWDLQDVWTGAHQLEKGSGENRPSGEGDCPDRWAKGGREARSGSGGKRTTCLSHVRSESFPRRAGGLPRVTGPWLLA